MLIVKVTPEQEIIALNAWLQSMKPHLKKADSHMIQTYAFVKSAATRLREVQDKCPAILELDRTLKVEVMP